MSASFATLTIAYLFVESFRQPDGEFPPSPLIRLAIVSLSPVVWNAVVLLVIFLISLFLGLMLNQCCPKFGAVMAMIAHALAAIGMVAFSSSCGHYDLRESSSRISPNTMRLTAHGGLPAREYIVKIVELSLWSGDLLLGRFSPSFLSVPTLVPYAV
ncbi:1,3-beta-D-glucan synthase [Ceratobasidium sp. 428]|nr:1,3-beta-D-glucan synthase [Ceratobasidium sp. 428]